MTNLVNLPNLLINQKLFKTIFEVNSKQFILDRMVLIVLKISDQFLCLITFNIVFIVLFLEMFNLSKADNDRVVNCLIDIFNIQQNIFYN